MMQLTVKNMDITLELNGTTCLIGPTNSGKTTFLKKLVNRINNDDIYIDDICIKEYDFNFLRNNIVVCFDDNLYHADFVCEELYYNIHKLGYRLDECVKKIEDICHYFKVDYLLDERLERLKYEDKILIKILSFLIINPHIFAIDNLMPYLSKEKQNKLYKYVKEHNICFINVVSDSEYILESDYVIVMSNFKALMCVDSYNVLNGNSILPYIGIKLPFAVDLSSNLCVYNIVNKVETDNRKLVDKIWK